jgi:hypothetical protein
MHNRSLDARAWPAEADAVTGELCCCGEDRARQTGVRAS